MVTTTFQAFPQFLTPCPLLTGVCPLLMALHFPICTSGSSCQLKVTACVDTDALPALLAGHQAGCTPGELPLPEMSATELAESSSLQRGGQESLNPVVWSDHGDDQEDGSKHDRLVPLDCITILRVVSRGRQVLKPLSLACNVGVGVRVRARAWSKLYVRLFPVQVCTNVHLRTWAQGLPRMLSCAV
eukprot:1136727-Pelagomonas_calceolata.AAC.1